MKSISAMRGAARAFGFRLRRHRRRDPGTPEDSRHRALGRLLAAGRHRPLLQHLDTRLQHPCRCRAQGTGHRRPRDAGAERLYTARFKLGLFDPPGSSLDRIPVLCRRIRDQSPHLPQGRRREHRSAEKQRHASAKSAGEDRCHRTDCGFTAFHPRQLRRHAAAPGHSARRHDEAVHSSSPILYAQGSTLAEGVAYRFRARPSA